MPARVRVLLVLLALKDSYPRKEVFGIFWPKDERFDDPEPAEQKRVRDKLDQVLSATRRVLGKEVGHRLTSRGGTIRLARGFDPVSNTELWTDVHDFLAAGGDRVAPLEVRRGLELVRGPLGDGLVATGTDLSFLDVERRRIRDDMVRMTKRAYPITQDRAMAVVDDILARGASRVLASLRDDLGEQLEDDEAQQPAPSPPLIDIAPDTPVTDGDALMVADLRAAGITRVYPHRELTASPDNAETRLRNEFRSHQRGLVRMMGVSLRVFFNHLGPFYPDIETLFGDIGTGISLQALTSHPGSPEVRARGEIEEPGRARGETPQIVRDIESTAATVRSMVITHGPQIELRQFEPAPYCTAVLFPHVAYFSPNLLAPAAPVRFPMILFDARSHGYDMLTLSFDHLWPQATRVVPTDGTTRRPGQDQADIEDRIRERLDRVRAAGRSSIRAGDLLDPLFREFDDPPAVHRTLMALRELGVVDWDDDDEPGWIDSPDVFVRIVPADRPAS